MLCPCVGREPVRRPSGICHRRNQRRSLEKTPLPIDSTLQTINSRSTAFRVMHTTYQMRLEAAVHLIDNFVSLV